MVLAGRSAGPDSVLQIVEDRCGGEFDDIELEKQAGGWRYSAKERYELGIDDTAPFYRISNFEGLDPTARIRTKNSEIRIVEEKKRGRVEIGTVDGGAEPLPGVADVGHPQECAAARASAFQPSMSAAAGLTKVVFPSQSSP